VCDELEPLKTDKNIKQKPYQFELSGLKQQVLRCYLNWSVDSMLMVSCESIQCHLIN